MCEPLSVELECGKEAARKVVEHLRRMNADRMMIPIIVEGCEYTVMVVPLPIKKVKFPAE